MTALASPLPRSGPLKHFEHGFNRIAMSQDSRYIATSDVDMNVVVRFGDRVVFERNFVSHNEKIRPTERVRGLVFSPGGDVLYVAAGSEVFAISTDGWVPVWSYEAPRSFGFLIISPIALDVAENGDVAAAFDNGSIVIWNGSGERKSIIRDNDSPRWMRFVASGDEIVGSDGFSLCGWHVQKRKRKLKLKVTGRVFGADADRAGKVAATRTLHDIVVWDLHEKDVLSVIPIRPGPPVLAVHPTAELLAFAERNVVKIANLKGKVVRQFDVTATSALSMAFTAFGDEVLIGCTEKTLIRTEL